MARIRSLTCARCGAAFDCGSGGRTGGCWCADEPHAIPLPASAAEDCVCPPCLRAAIAQQTAKGQQCERAS